MGKTDTRNRRKHSDDPPISWDTRRHFWRFELEDGVHYVELDHGFWSGRREVFLDGHRIALVPRNLLDWGGEHEFTVCGHTCSAQVKYFGGIEFTYRFSLDGGWLEKCPEPPQAILLRPAVQQQSGSLMRPAKSVIDSSESLLQPASIESKDSN